MQAHMAAPPPIKKSIFEPKIVFVIIKTCFEFNEMINLILCNNIYEYLSKTKSDLTKICYEKIFMIEISITKNFTDVMCVPRKLCIRLVEMNNQ